MAEMVLLDERITPAGESGTATRQDLVSVVARGLRHRAVCSCGWTGGSRVFFAPAKMDGLIHSAQKGHRPADALVA
jgi:hypothetical protein